MSWLPREIKKKRSKALLQICSAWGHGVAQHSSALVAFSQRAPLARAASQCSVGTRAAEELRKRADMLGSRQRGEICVLAGQRISATKDKGKIQQHNRVWVEKGRRARSLQKEGSLEVRQVLPEGRNCSAQRRCLLPALPWGRAAECRALAFVPEEISLQ